MSEADYLGKHIWMALPELSVILENPGCRDQKRHFRYDERYATGHKAM